MVGRFLQTANRYNKIVLKEIYGKVEVNVRSDCDTFRRSRKRY